MVKEQYGLEVKDLEADLDNQVHMDPQVVVVVLVKDKVKP